MISLKPIKLKQAQLSIEQINTYINKSNTMTIEEARSFLIESEVYVVETIDGKRYKRKYVNSKHSGVLVFDNVFGGDRKVFGINKIKSIIKYNIPHEEDIIRYEQSMFDKYNELLKELESVKNQIESWVSQHPRALL